MDVVYIETTFVSLLVADPSRDLITAANQQATRDWWQLRRMEFHCITSDEVVREAEKGDPEQVRKRLEIVRSLPMITRTPEAENLTAAFMSTGAIPTRAAGDAAHLAIATLAGADYLLTWNCRHLANGHILRRISRAAASLGWDLPIVCTPPALMAP
jgi:hypothetical protein